MSSRRSWSTVILAAALGVTAAMFAAQAAAAEETLAQQGPVTATGVLVGPVEGNTPDPTSEYVQADRRSNGHHVRASKRLR